MPPGVAQDDKGAAALGEEPGRQCASPLCAGAHHYSTVNRLAAACILVNVHPLLSERDALHHGRAAHIEEIGAPGKDGARLFRKAGRAGGW